MQDTAFLLKISKQRQLTLPSFLETFGFNVNQPVRAKINEMGNLEIEKPVDKIASLQGILKNQAKHKINFKDFNDQRAYALKAKYKRA